MNGEPGSVYPGNEGPIPSETRAADPPAEASMRAGPQEVTRLLADWSQGDRAALEKLTPLVYEMPTKHINETKETAASEIFRAFGHARVVARSCCGQGVFRGQINW